MQRFVITTSLFTDEYACDVLKDYDRIYVVEDPVHFVPHGRSKLVMLRAALKSYSAWLEWKFPNIPVVYVLRSQVLTKGKTIFDYFIGENAQIHMWRLDAVRCYGEKPYDYTYNGINIKYFDSPIPYVLNFRTVRDSLRNVTVGTIMRMVIKELELDDSELLLAVNKIINVYIRGNVDNIERNSRSLDISIDSSDAYNKAVEHVTRTYTVRGPVTRCAVNFVEAGGLLNIFVTKILPTYAYGDIWYISYCCDMGLLGVRQLVNAICESGADNERKARAIVDLCMREYHRVLFVRSEFLEVETSTFDSPPTLNAQHDKIKGFCDIGTFKKYCAYARICKCDKTKLINYLVASPLCSYSRAYALATMPISKALLDEAQLEIPTQYAAFSQEPKITKTVNGDKCNGDKDEKIDKEDGKKQDVEDLQSDIILQAEPSHRRRRRHKKQEITSPDNSLDNPLKILNDIKNN